MEKILAWAVVAGTVLLVFKIRRKKNIKKISVKLMLEQLTDEYVVFNDLVVVAQNGMSRIDFVVVSPYGVFVIDTRHEMGKIFGDSGDREWAVGRKQTIYNPLWRNRTHVNGLEKFIGQLPYVSLVVFLNGRLKSDFGTNVVELPRMLPVINRYQRQTLKPERCEEIINILRQKQPEK